MKAKSPHPEFTRSLDKAQKAASAGRYWLASLWVNRARLYGKVTSRHLRKIGVTQSTGK